MTKLTDADRQARAELCAFISKALDAAGVSVADLARHLGRSRAWCRKCLDPDQTSCFPVYMYARINVLLGGALLRRDAGVLGYSLQPVMDGPRTTSDLVTAAASAMKEASEAVTAAAESASGGVTPSEAATYRKQSEEAKQALAVLDATVETLSI